MPSQEEIYPLTLKAILTQGIEEWFDNYEPLLNIEKFQEVYSVVLDIFADEMNKSKDVPSIYWSCAINYKLILTIATNYYQYLLLLEIKTKGYKKVKYDTEESVSFYIKKALNHDYLQQNISKNSFKGKMLEKLRYMKQNHKTHGIIKSILHKVKKDICIIGDSEDAYIKSYLDEKHLIPEYIRPIFNYTKIQDNISLEENVALDKFIISFMKRIHKYGDIRFFDQNFIEQLKELFRSTIIAFNHVNNNIKETHLPPLLVESIHYNVSRVIAAAWKNKGGTVIGVTHGNSYLTGIKAGPLAKGSLSICDVFLLPSVGEKIQLERGKMMEKVKFNSHIDYVLHKNNNLKTIYETERKVKKIKKIKKVMLIGFPMDFYFYPSLTGHDTLNYTHLTLQILKSLRKEDYQILYKAHPDSLNETRNFFDKYVDEIITDDFSDVYHETDCIFYISPYTTTFGLGMLTNIPIVYVNNIDWDLWHPEIKKHLDQRAVGFAVKADKNGVVKPVQDNLSECIKESINKMDHTVVEKFAF